MLKTYLLTLMLGLILITPGLALGNTYYIAANGSDSNNGTSKTTPWLHAPGMPNCASNCASYTSAPGDNIIFRGGDTWHFGNSSASPYSGGTWNWTSSGSSTSFIYVGVDQTWFSGSAWTRPILTADNPTSTSVVASCTYSAGSTNVIAYLHFIRYVTFDNFEMTGLCWNGASGANNNYLSYGGSVAGFNNPFTISNVYIHGWTYTSGAGQANGTALAGYDQNWGVTIQGIVIDGSDSEYHGLSPFNGGADAYIFEDSIVRFAGGTSVPTDCHILHDVTFEFMSNVTDNSTHTDIFMCFGEANDKNHPADGMPNLFYNNVFRYIGTIDSAPVSSVFWEFPPGSPAAPDYVFNNVFHDYYGQATNYNNFCEGGCWPNSQAVLFNNTEEASLPNYNGCVICNGSSSGATITSVNNYWITNSGTGPAQVFQSASNVTESAAVYQTITTANSQGFSSSNDFAETATSDSTVGAGINETNGFCANLQNAAAQAACTNGTTDGCAYNSTSHAMVCPATAAAARPSTAGWDIGAFELGSVSNRPLPPSNLKAVIND